MDLAAIRLLSRWMSAQRELSELLEQSTAVGPRAEERVRGRLGALQELDAQARAALQAYAAHVTSARQSVPG